MKRSMLAKLLCLVMLVNCFVFNFAMVSADEVTISYDNVEGALADFGDHLKGMAKDDRISAYHSLKDFIKTDAGMDTLLAYVESVDSLPEVTTPTTAAEKLTNFLISVKGYKNEMLFTLSFLKSIPEANRIEAFEDLEARKALGYEDDSSEEAVENVYAELVTDEDVRKVLKDDHAIDAAVFMQMMYCMTDLYTITDDDEYLALLSIDDDDFEDALVANVSKYFEKVNGKSTGKAENILNAILIAVNNKFSSSVLEDIKTVFAELEMYEPHEEEEGGKISGGSSGKKPPVATITPVPTLPPVIVTPEETFIDINGHWAKPFIDPLAERNIVKGYEDNTFRPDAEITRQEMAVMLVRALGIEDQLGDANVDSGYSDDAEIAVWARAHINLLSEMDVYRGYGEGHFGPERLISREEAVALISRLVTKEPAELKTLTFADLDQIKEWFMADVEKVYSLGLIRGYEDNTFRPEGTILRSEAATLIYNYMSAEGKM